MHLPYQPVPRFYIERITIATLCNESMDLHWHDPGSQQSYMARVMAAGCDRRKRRRMAGGAQ